MSDQHRELERAIARLGLSDIDDAAYTEAHAAFARAQPEDVQAWARGHFAQELNARRAPAPRVDTKPLPPQQQRPVTLLEMTPAEREHHRLRVGDRQFRDEVMRDFKGVRVVPG